MSRTSWPARPRSVNLTFRPPTETRSEWLAQSIQTVKVLAELVPVPYVKGVLGVVVILLETVEKVQKNRDELKELCENTLRVAVSLGEQLTAHHDTTASMLKELCTEFAKHLHGILPALEKLQRESQSFGGRVKEVMKASSTASKIAAYQKSIQQLQSDFKFITLVDMGFKVNEIHASLALANVATIPLNQSINTCPPPSRIFQGRQTILVKMYQFFTPDSVKQCIYVLHGLGGAGKTQIALKFIRESSGSFSDTFLVDASTLDTINTGLKNIAVSKGVGDSTQDALKWLQSKHERWLLFFDNSDDPGINLHEFFPLCDHGNIIITSRNPGLKVYGEHSPVSDMEEADAIALLLRSATKESTEENFQAAAKVVKELFYLPLAIAQAGAFISKSEDLDNYLALYGENRAQLLREKPAQSHDQYAWTVYTTWQISFNQLSQPAATLLQLCSFIHYSGISEDIFSNASKYSFPVWLPPKEELQEPLEFLSHFLGPTEEWNSLNFLHVANELKAYSLISLDPKTKMFSIHPLVHAWSRTTLVDDMPSRSCINSILGMSISEIPDSDLILASLTLMPHVDLITTFNANVGADFRAAFWYIYLSAGRLKEAQDLIEQTSEKYKSLFGEEHPATLKAIHRLAVTYRHLGEYKKAEELQATVLDKRTKLLGEDHPETLSTMGYLAVTHFMLGNFVKAKELEVTVLEKQITLLGKDHPDTLRAMGNLAATHSDLGDFVKANELEITVLERRAKVLGEEHPDTLRAM
ncbi:P-loop containing nucleoside triphosphate hydrolase protein, partial [Mycena alexandri]